MACERVEAIPSDPEPGNHNSRGDPQAHPLWLVDHRWHRGSALV